MRDFDNKPVEFINVVYSKIRWLEYQRQEEEKISENESALRKKRIRTGLSILCASVLIIIPVFLDIGFNMLSAMLNGTILLSGAALYENILN